MILGMGSVTAVGGVVVLLLVGLVALVIVVGLVVLTIYNSLVALRQTVKNAWAQIDVQLKRRHDLIPNLVNTVKGYAAHEKETLERVVAARASATGKLPQKSSGRELSSALARLLAVAKVIRPQGHRNFLALQEAGFHETRYLSPVSSIKQRHRYNTNRNLPNVLFAGMLIQTRGSFETGSDEVPQVQFGTGTDSLPASDRE